MKAPFISIVIPAAGAVPFIKDCLTSVLEQSFTDYECIVVDDSPSYDKEVRQQYKAFIKTVPSPKRKAFSYIAHSKNLGSLEARRTGIMQAKGTYTYCMDNDDFLSHSNTLQTLVNAISAYNTDIIVCGAALTGITPQYKSEYIEAKKASLDLSLYFAQKQPEMSYLEAVFIRRVIPVYVWQKCIRTTIYQKAFDAIPTMDCFEHDDLLMAFFVALCKPSFSVIHDTLYTYRLGGESTHPCFDTLQKWQHLCSASSVFTTIFMYIQEHPEDTQLAAVEKELLPIYHSSIRSCIQCLEKVPPHLKETAQHLLYEYWGEEIVKKVHQAMQK